MTKTVRPPTSYTNGVKLQQLQCAGLDPVTASDYELDHLIALAIGGHPSKVENLWLQPWEGENGARRKDRLEVKLQCLVCTGQVSLANAQQEMARDWVTAYHRYATIKCRRSGEDRDRLRGLVGDE